MNDASPRRHRWITALVILVVLAVIIGVVAWYNFFRTEPEPAWVNQDARTHFLYASIGTEGMEGIPVWIYIVLPKMFPEYLPAPGGYTAVGMLWEQGHELPIGVTRKHIGFDRVGLNCAFCHVSRVRLSPDQAIPTYYPGGPSHQFDSQAYQQFLFNAASDPRFTSSNVMNAINQIAYLSWWDKLLYRFILIPFTKRAFLEQKKEFAWQFTHNRPLQGPGRVDPFNPVRFRIFHEADDGSVGNADIPSIWNQRVRTGHFIHWDGLAKNLTQVAWSSALGDGARNKYLDTDSLAKVVDFVTNLPPSPYPGTIDRALAASGKPLWDANCKSCHEPGGAQFEAVQTVGTDMHRSDAWTQSQVDNWKKMGDEYKRKYNPIVTFDAMSKQVGYVNAPLDGIWIKGPYLHNGSVPSLRALLDEPAQRPVTFYRGYDVLDQKNGGYISNVATDGTHKFFLYDTRLLGNGNGGHTFGTTLTPAEKDALVEYMKTL